MRKIIVSNCNNCQWGDKECANINNKKCSDFSPINEKLYVKELMEILRENNVPSKEKKLSRNFIHSKSITYNDGIKTLDNYYVDMINDTLKEIRRGFTAYVFNEDQIEELIKFEPNINVELHDGIFYISL